MNALPVPRPAGTVAVPAGARQLGARKKPIIRLGMGVKVEGERRDGSRFTRPEKTEVLEAFYARIRPGGGGWRPIAAKVPAVDVDRNLLKSIGAAFFATGVVYLTLPGIGYLLFGRGTAATLSLGGALVCGTLAYLLVRNVGWEKIVR